VKPGDFPLGSLDSRMAMRAEVVLVSEHEHNWKGVEEDITVNMISVGVRREVQQ
jgi:hypothetical protein